MSGEVTALEHKLQSHAEKIREKRGLENEKHFKHFVGMKQGRSAIIKTYTRDDAMERATRVSVSVLPSSELAEVACGLRNDFVVEFEDCTRASEVRVSKRPKRVET